MRFLVVLFLLANTGFSQTSKPDSQIQQQILDELRAIHRDLRATTTLQLLLAELQLAQTSVDRATQRRDALKGQVTQLEADEKTAQADVARIQAGLETSSNPDLKKQFVGRLEELKEGLRNLTVQKEAKSELLQDTEGQLRTARAELEDVQAQLSDLTKKLSSVN